MGSGERAPRSHSEANQDLFNKIERYSEEIKNAETRMDRGKKVMDAFFAQFDTPHSRASSRDVNSPEPKPRDIPVQVYDPDRETKETKNSPRDIPVQVYDPDNPNPEPDPPRRKTRVHEEPTHDINIQVYDPDREASEIKGSSRGIPVQAYDPGLKTATKKTPYESISKKEAQGILKQAKFKDIEALDYISENFAPKYKVDKIGGADIYLSEIIPSRSRPHVVIYTKAEGKDTIEPKPFYRSRSSMLWRLLPQLRENGGYGKSYYEEDAINAPLELQNAIEQIYADEQKDPSYMKKYNDKEYNKQICDKIDSYLTPNSRGEGDISNEVSMRSVGSAGSMTPGFDHVWERLPDPDECIVPDNLMPNFDKIEKEWQIKNDVYGKVTARCFKSHDGSLEYLICQTRKGGAWVSAVECVDSKVSSIGLRDEFVKPGALTTPFYEYRTQAKGYRRYWGNLNDTNGPYVSMDQYHSRIPLIQEFHRHF